jgi:hypothetical protein
MTLVHRNRASEEQFMFLVFTVLTWLECQLPRNGNETIPRAAPQASEMRLESGAATRLVCSRETVTRPHAYNMAER